MVSNPKAATISIAAFSRADCARELVLGLFIASYILVKKERIGDLAKKEDLEAFAKKVIDR